MSRDIADTIRGGAAARSDVGGCHLPVWSSPLSSSKAAVPAEVAATYGVARSWVYDLVARYRAEGDAAFEPRSRRPHTSPRRSPVSDGRADRPAPPTSSSCTGLDAGRHDRLAPRQHHQSSGVESDGLSHPARRGLTKVEPKKRPRSSYIRFEADLPNEMWQADFTHWRLADGVDVEILCWLDDHSRHALSVTAHRRVTGHHRRRHVPDALSRPRRPGVDADRQRDGVHHPPVGRQRRPQRVRTDLRQPRHRPEELATEPSDHLRQGRTLPPDAQSLAARPPDQPPRSPSCRPCRPFRRQVQPRAPAPLTPRPHPRRRLPRPTQSQPRRPAATTPTTGSATTASPAATSPCASTASSTTSASAATSTEPPSSCSSTTSTSASSTPPPARSSATSPSTPTAATTAPADHRRTHTDPENQTSRTLNAGSAVRDVSRHHRCPRQDSNLRHTV